MNDRSAVVATTTRVVRVVGRAGSEVIAVILAVKLGR
jgi:hypothetical protein